MAIEKPVEKDRAVADERAVRRFLERAAPTILESRVLDGGRFEAVVRLADELGLSRDQLACELRLLEQRKVITSAPWEQLEDFVAPVEPGKSTAPPPTATGETGPSEEPGDVSVASGPPRGPAASSPPPPPRCHRWRPKPTGLRSTPGEQRCADER